MTSSAKPNDASDTWLVVVCEPNSGDSMLWWSVATEEDAETTYAALVALGDEAFGSRYVVETRGPIAPPRVMTPDEIVADALVWLKDDDF